ncbi:hypothetical protein [Streptomyces sp. B6B3]|uniref:hypothetical protein n=1 Tax=Streptomyces sp. B6B3 TaxID=3153570 RepID=UPI00325F028A
MNCGFPRGGFPPAPARPGAGGFAGPGLAGAAAFGPGGRHRTRGALPATGDVSLPALCRLRGTPSRRIGGAEEPW